jgi:hypothetical protein
MAEEAYYFISNHDAGIAKGERAVSRYNRNIRIQNNTFRVFDPRLVRDYSVDGLVFQINWLETCADYPSLHAKEKPFDVEFSDHIHLEPPTPYRP